MEYTATEIVELTGVPLRTIRLWTSRRLLPRPLGKGPGTRYTEEHRVLIRVIAELRKEVHELAVIRMVIGKRTPEELLRIIGEEPEEPEEPEEQPPAAVAAPPSPREQPLPGAPSPAPPLPPAGETHRPLGAQLEQPLPDGPRWVIVGLLPQLAIMVGEGASPLARRIAAEIVERYGQER